ncbi:MAG: GNAT family N-acetyltransferase [Ruminococcus sp.]|nr:GNAT family N-acetyltransferase [Ruminococcus sp.]
MTVQILVPGSELWERTIAFAEGCSWRAGRELSRQMREGSFRGWERVFAAVSNGEPVGFCTLTEKDCCPAELPWSPFIGFVFVDEAFRGRRISQALINAASAYAGSLGSCQVFAVSGEEGLYEKLGLTRLTMIQTIYGETEQLFVMNIGGNNGEIRSL